MTVRVLGIDPGLTRCGVGVVDVEPDRRVTLVYYGVVASSATAPIEERLHTVGVGIEALIDEHAPHAMAVERVFAQHNLRTVMGTAQVSGLALRAAAARSIPVGLRTPSEVKAAITGYGAADKKQVQTMVARVLRLAEPPQPADAADALAIAICHAWRASAPDSRTADIARLTPAQRAWLAAERGTKR
ncbi:crossover junction endodeoxyribonuclease RuvC [Labedella populi]|uniref:crossover junction endodeoxyribonuclease RuvC n=1 Tax=Labedella populi TaxID=2498850 RepID=UPI001AA034EF|nr:crossover junction endodeoxyribonuclease RuvC [Labedella populi]